MSQNPTEGADSTPSEPGPANPYPAPAGTPSGEGLPPYHSYAPPPPPPPYGSDNLAQQSGYGAAYPPAYSPGPQVPLHVRSDSPLGPDEPTVLSQPSSWPYSPYPMPPQPAPSTPPPPPRKKGKGILVFIVAIALTIVVGGVLGVVLYTNYQNNGQKTAADATAQANASSTANAQATATYVQTHYPFSANLVLNDPLNNNRNNNSNAAQYGWETNTGCVFTGGAYRVIAAKQGSSAQKCTAQKTNFTNFTYEIQMTIETGGDNAAGGIFFRADPVSNQGYILFLRIDGYYEFSIASGPNHYNTIQSGTLAAHSLGFHQVHTIGIVANGSHISVYLDQNQVTQVSDTTLTSGKIGVFAQYGRSSTTVAYTNAKVWQL